jgi:hypothetical protein
MFFNTCLFYYAFFMLNLAVLKALNVIINTFIIRTLFIRLNKDFIFVLLSDTLRAIKLDFIVLIR